MELSINEPENLQKVAHALSSDVRLRIITLLNTESLNIQELAEILDKPVSTIAAHIKVLEESNLVLTELRPADRGVMKVCTRNFDDIHIELNVSKNPMNEFEVYEIEMPIGHYTDFRVSPTCEMADGNGHLVPEDNPAQFYNPVRTNAQLIWTRKGTFEYRFPLLIPKDAVIEQIELSLELCSEAPNYDHNWPSDITVRLNEVEIGTWTSPGDFGDRPGKLNSKSWSETTSTQYGILKTWKVTNKNSMIDDVFLSDRTINDLNIFDNEHLTFCIGVKEDAIHKGGINIFGKEMGDYPQDIKLRILYTV